MNHDIKILMNHYQRVKEGTKTFEIRKNDRYYQKGDTVVMFPILESHHNSLDYPVIKATVGDVYPICDDFVVFGLVGVK